MAEIKNYFTELNAINVSEHVEKKNGLSYLSWPYAWEQIKKADPKANYVVYENTEGWNYFTDGKTAWVKVGVTAFDIEHVEMLPVMDFKNNSLPVDKITSFDVNKAIQRCLTKAVARHGIGLYIYAGEDLPIDETKEPAKKATKGSAAAPNAPEGKITLPEYKKRIQAMLVDMKVKKGDEAYKSEYKTIIHDIVGDVPFKCKDATEEQLPTVEKIYNTLVAKGYAY